MSFLEIDLLFKVLFNTLPAENNLLNEAGMHFLLDIVCIFTHKIQCIFQIALFSFASDEQIIKIAQFGMPAGFIIGAGLMFFIYRIKRNQNNDQIPGITVEAVNKPEDLRHELAGKVLQLASTTEMMISVSRRIRDLLPRVGTKEKEDLISIISELEEKTYGDAWHEFETQISHFDRDFYRVLAELYPSLTPAEKRVCTFLRLNLTTKEIAALTNRSTRTIDFTRNSIRKKLELSSETNLTTFLLSI